MRFTILIIIPFSTFIILLLAEKEPYEFELERWDRVYINRKFYDEFFLNATRYNRTTKAMTLKFIQKVDIHDVLMIDLQAFKKLGSDYRYTGMGLKFNLCKVLEQTMFPLSDIMGNTNFSKCPIKKGTYYMTSGMPSTKRFPPNLPTGQWKIKTQMFFNDEKANELDVYLQLKKK